MTSNPCDDCGAELPDDPEQAYTVTDSIPARLVCPDCASRTPTPTGHRTR